MKITEQIMKTTYEKTIDNSIDDIKRIQSDGLTEENDILLLDACLKYVIFMSDVRNKEQKQ
jgi:hypothetical protein